MAPRAPYTPPPYGQPPQELNLQQGQVNPYAPPQPPPQAPASSAYGDKAGEHLRMKRGRFGASIYVGMAFLMQIALVGGVVALPGSLIATFAFDDQSVANVLIIVALVMGLLAGIVGAYFIFRDRWKCIEAFSSRWCAGIMNLSVLYVPFVALVYANVRGVQKMLGK